MLLVGFLSPAIFRKQVDMPPRANGTNTAILRQSKLFNHFHLVSTEHGAFA